MKELSLLKMIQIAILFAATFVMGACSGVKGESAGDDDSTMTMDGSGGGSTDSGDDGSGDGTDDGGSGGMRLDDGDEDDGGEDSGDWGDPSFDPDCSQGGAFLTGAERHDDVAAAVATSAAGDVITVCPGSFITHVDVVHELTIEGTGDPEATVLDGDGQPGSIVSASGSFTLTLERLTLRDGRGTLGSNGSTGGGALYADGASLDLRSLRFEGNGGDYGSAIASNGHVDGTWLTIVDGASNSVSVSSSTGSASLSLSNTVIRGQDEDVCIAATGIPLSLDDVEINGCPTTPISVSGVTLSLSGVELSDAGPGRSGGIEVFASDGVIEDLRVSGGDATVGGALMVTQPGDSELVLRGGELSGNSGRKASAVFLEFQPPDGATVVFDGVDFGDGGDEPTLAWETVNGVGGELQLSGVSVLVCTRAGCE